jgi:hypothetical protein
MARPAVHLIVSTGLATLQWIRTGRLAPAVAPLITGFLIDADHFYDLVRYQHRGGARGRVVLPLHGWEYLALLWLIDRTVGRRLAGGLVLGYLGHLLVDQVTNTTTHPLTYFLTFRWLRGFPSALFNHPDETQVDWMQQSVFGLWRHF